ncbi:MAG: ABC transporter permease [Deltaproteobacteria bacterium]|nr:ABC transporter permease [Deltaproteobacteria bacterium]MBW2302124.1 ABC transporter permease [Deltaproteobacteria bacterium]
MTLLKFIAKRLGYAAGVLIGLSILLFMIARVMPGNPARMALGPRAPQWAIERLQEEMHLNAPIYIQYYYWIKGAVRGDFGESLISRRDVAEDIKEYFPASLELALYAAVIMGVMGVFFGVISGWFANTWIDNVVRVFAYIGVVTPSFVFAIFFVLIFSYWLEILPTIGRLSSGIAPPPEITGMLTIDSLLSGNFQAFWDGLKHVILPAVSLAMGPMAQEARITRSSMSDNAQKDFIALERTCGIPEKVIMFKYLLKPSLIPTISIYGLDIAGLMGNAFLIELIFNWPGLSRYGMNAILQKDLNAMVASILVFGLVFITLNIIVDLIVDFLDPRMRHRA